MWGMEAAELLRRARRRAGLSQRALAASTGVAQPTIARIEAGRADPRVATLARLLQACGETLGVTVVAPPSGQGVDRSMMRELLALTPRERLQTLVDEAAVHEQLLRARRIQ